LKMVANVEFGSPSLVRIREVIVMSQTKQADE